MVLRVATCWVRTKKYISELHGPSMFAVMAKIYGVLYKQSSSIAFGETSSYWSALKNSQFLGFSLVTSRLSGFHWSAFHSHEGSTFTEKYRNKFNYRIRRKADQITSYCSYARPAQPGPNRTRLCGPCIAALAGYP